MRNDSPQAAAVALVRVRKLEAFVQTFAYKVELRAVYIGQAFGINQNFYAVVFKNDVFRLRNVYVFEFVSQARATSGFNTQAHTQTLSPFRKVTVDMLCSRFGQGDGHEKT
jgi:hypothetical protein